MGRLGVLKSSPVPVGTPISDSEPGPDDWRKAADPERPPGRPPFSQSAVMLDLSLLRSRDMAFVWI